MAAPKKAPLVARETFATDIDGERVVVVAGQTVDGAHPVVKGREALFSEPGPDVAAPAPKRTRSRKARG